MSTHYSILFKQKDAHEDDIWSCAWGKSEKDGTEHIVTGALDDKVKCWKWVDEQLELKWVLEGHQLGIVSVDINNTGTIAASSSLDAHIRLWDLDSGKQLRAIDGGTVETWTVTFSPDGRHIATGGQSGKIVIINVDDGRNDVGLDTRGKLCFYVID